MQEQNQGQGSMAGIITAALLVIGVIQLDLLNQAAGISLLVLYFIMALLFITGHIRALLVGCVAVAAALMLYFIAIGDDSGVIDGRTGLILLFMVTIILALVLEYIFVLGARGIEKLEIYRQYLLLNLVQAFTVMFSITILFLSPRLVHGAKAPDEMILNVFTVLVILFAVSAALFTSFLLKSMFSDRFMGDFARALYDLNRDREYEDKKSGIKQDEVPPDFFNAFKRMRLITYLFFAASFVSIFLISKTRVIDLYVEAVKGKNQLIDFVIMLIKYPPPAITGIMKLVFIWLDILIAKEILEFIFKKPLKILLKQVLEIPDRPAMTVREKESTSFFNEITGYCLKTHGREVICDECNSVLRQTLDNVRTCKFGEAKKPCAECEEDCFGPGLREKLKNIMSSR
jgi:hypothetical protein